MPRRTASPRIPPPRSFKPLAISAGLADVDGDIARPTAESQQAGIDHLVRIATEQGAAQRCPVAEPTMAPSETETMREETGAARDEAGEARSR